MEVTCIEQNQDSRYARLGASDQEVPGRCAKFGIENQDTARSGGKQFKCSRLIHFFRSSPGPFTDGCLGCGGLTRRVACFALRL